MAASTPHRILLVEDNPDHSDLTSLVLAGSGIEHQIIYATDGQDAIERLQGTGPYEGEPLRPELILLDIKLPRVDGFTVLRTIREDRDLAVTPVVVLTTSGNPADIEHAVAVGASDYIIKPIGLNEFERKLVAVVRYWFGVSDLGRGRPASSRS